MSQLRLLTLPYHLGRERVGMGNGPDQLLAAGAESRARARGLTVGVDETTTAQRPDHEAGATFAVLREHARQVRRALDDGAVPLTFGGNCNTAIATAAALGGQDRLGVIWCDAHGDANTADTTTSGFLDGMSLAMLVGWCWRALTDSVPGFKAVPERNVLLAAGRAFDAGEQQSLQHSDITVVPASHMRTPAELTDHFLPALDALAGRVDRLYVHIDLDAIDPADGHANGFAAPHGPTLDALAACLDHVGERGQPAAASISSYDPACDGDGAACQSALLLYDRLLSMC